MHMASEETPLLHDDTEIAAINAHEAIYSRFSNKTKHIIVALVSWSAVLPCKPQSSAISLELTLDSVCFGDVYTLYTPNC